MKHGLSVTFIEEFANRKNLNKLNLIKKRTRVQIAARSLSEFYKLRNYIKKIKKDVEFVYWPLLSISEGYWFSPFADYKAIRRIFSELENRKEKGKIWIRLDLEFPRSRLINISRNFIHSFKNKRIITEFVVNAKKNNIGIITAEYAYAPESLLEILGLAYNTKTYGNHKLKMMFKKPIGKRFFLKLLKRKIRRYIQKYRDNLIIETGLTARGVSPFEWIATPEEIKSYIEIAREEGVKQVLIFRLGGLNKDYLDALEGFWGKG
jgi:hypothetical protein